MMTGDGREVDCHVAITAREAAHLLGVKESTIRNWDAAGLIHAIGSTTLRAKLYAYRELVEVDHTQRRKPTSHRPDQPPIVLAGHTL
jgi:transcription initiation factor TFIIIB Brf1 subunit/transcription initiation factor TFIIB